MTTALIVVDVQNDFCEGGSLAVSGGSMVAARVADYVNEHAGSIDLLIATRDWHSRETLDHFAAAGTAPDYSRTWPEHCMADTDGAEFHPAFAETFKSRPFVEIRKGQHSAAYSGFEGTAVSDPRLTLGDILDQYVIDEIRIVGLATDHCVRATARDARDYLASRERDGKVVVIEDLTAPVSVQAGEDTKTWMRSVDIVVTTAEPALAVDA